MSTLDRILAPEPPPFALLYRPERGPDGTVDVLVGPVSRPATLGDVPVRAGTPTGGRPVHDVLLLVPYRQLAERGFAAPDDGTPLVAITVTDQATVPLAAVLDRLPDEPATVTGGHFEPDDAGYAELVRRIVTDEIGTGQGANFVIKRSFVAELPDYSVRQALSFFRRLLHREQGAYWTFIVHTRQSTLVGATPERHLTLDGDTAVMNPISGTYRYPASGPTLRGMLDFLADGKETEELYMVLDEELKMMARICARGGRVTGPYLKEMTRLAHTGYLITGRTHQDVREVLRATMFAPTVTGSPLESAARVIAHHEPAGRRYYSGIAALLGRNADGGTTLDSAILIRTADIDPSGRLRIDVGATLVRHSDPASEVAETRVKAAGLLGALDGGPAGGFQGHPDVRAALRRRNDRLADFWLRARAPAPRRELTGVSALVIDAEDSFTAMLDQQLRSLGLAVTVRRFDEGYDPTGYDVVVLGPGPGDPRDDGHPKIAQLRSTVDRLLADRRPMLAVCLSHQVLSRRLGFELYRREVPNQGLQRDIELFGRRERVGFYNTYAARGTEDVRAVDGVGRVEVSRDASTGEVHALRGPRFASMQFHAESVLTVDGPRIVADALRAALGSPPGGRVRPDAMAVAGSGRDDA